MTKVISLIVPVFNEEETINIFYRTVRKELILPDCVVEIVFINDGSRDKTESIINGLAQDDELVKAFSFTRNFGRVCNFLWAARSRLIDVGGDSVTK